MSGRGKMIPLQPKAQQIASTEMADQENLVDTDERLGTFVFKRATSGRDMTRISQLYLKESSGRPQDLNKFASALLYACASLQVAMIDPEVFDWFDCPDDTNVLDMYGRYEAWVATFRQRPDESVGEAGGAEQSDGGVGV